MRLRRKSNKRNPNWKKEAKQLLFADDMILHICVCVCACVYMYVCVCIYINPEDATRKLLELINSQKSLAFLYTDNKKSKRD